MKNLCIVIIIFYYENKESNKRIEVDVLEVILNKHENEVKNAYELSN